MEAVGLGLAIVATVDLCLKYGEVLVDAYKTYKNAETEIRERALRVEVFWTRTHEQMLYIREAHDDFDREIAEMQSRILDILQIKLKRITQKFNGLHNEKLVLKRWKLVATKECLDGAIADLAEWQNLFDPTWYLILKLASHADHNGKVAAGAQVVRSDVRAIDTVRRGPHLESAKAPSVFFDEDRLESAEKVTIPYSDAFLATVRSGGKSYIVESRPCDPSSHNTIITRDIRTIAERLRSIEPSKFSILQCKGVIRKKHGDQLRSFDLVFRHPAGFEGTPMGFRTLLHGGIRHSLTERLKIAQQLARAVCYVHTLDFVHKNIRPESILAYKNQDTVLGAVFLAGFQRFRAVDGRTRLRELSKWDNNLYRHPDRQGSHPEETYIMQHDIYSLGVCLLEIGLWSSFVQYIGNEPSPGPILDVTTDFFSSPKAVKDKLVSMARDQVPSLMGNMYANVVINCLTCLDSDNIDFAYHAEFQDDDGILIGVKYIEKILMNLESIAF